MTTNRIHACLDGELPRSALTAAERARLAELEAVLETAITPLRGAPVPDFTDSVMQAMPSAYGALPSAAAEARPGVWARLGAWLWGRRSVTVRYRPAYALASLAAALFAGVLLTPGVSRPAAETTPLYVQFRLEAPGASSVALAGSFTGWQPEFQLVETSPGVWTAVVPLEPGVHDYAFVVDGNLVMDPHAPRVADSFGGSNSRLFLPTPAGRV